jgi:hypothetical protein
MINDEKKYENLLNDLKNLPKVNAPQNFEANILRKVRLEEQREKESFWKNIFTPGKLVPAAVAIASAVIIFLIIDLKPERIEDPLNLQPRLREDIVNVQSIDEFAVLTEEKPEQNKSAKLKNELNKSEYQRKTMDSENKLSLSKEREGLKDKAVESKLRAESLSTNSSASVAGGISSAQENDAVSEPKKENFNFMQINLSPKEKKEVERLKEHLKIEEKAKSD